jgi:hypothetical protein
VVFYAEVTSATTLGSRAVRHGLREPLGADQHGREKRGGHAILKSGRRRRRRRLQRRARALGLRRGLRLRRALTSAVVGRGNTVVVGRKPLARRCDGGGDGFDRSILRLRMTAATTTTALPTCCPRRCWLSCVKNILIFCHFCVIKG